ncbi:glycosyl hydrolases family 18-domain-containing protein [Jimgerdemannia flammicorona]|uniref:chitinase n=1 Tax=Jimgerdemannia flammicorona TaxID=994334 RepID=A0A433QA48_9FUNG|nr:glycosyl hydrolases family 18-domain-containing protein [Jimgerdemannia flammicorona]
MIPLAFAYVFFGTGNQPVLNFANICNYVDNATFPGTQLVNCPTIASDIKFCQSKGKAITLALGGAGGTYGFSGDAQAMQFADQLWDEFLGGSASIRPFGDVILDGVDLDIEQGGAGGYPAFINTLRAHFAADSRKKYYITGAPQCVHPDAALSLALNSVWFDLVFVQFYNNPCGLGFYSNNVAWNYGVWDYWATHISVNPDVKVLIGAPAAPTAAGSGYVDLSTLKAITQNTHNSANAFGGIMYWDASQAWLNPVGSQNYASATKSFLRTLGSASLLACSAPAWESGKSYSGAAQVTRNGYTFVNRWYSSADPATDYTTNGAWNIIGACGGASPKSTSTSTVKTTTGGTSTSTASISTSSPASPSCTAPDWVSTTAYNGGATVSYNGYTWTARYWTQNDVPGSNVNDVWTKGAVCSATVLRQAPKPRQLAAGSCTAAAWVSTTAYNGGAQVSYGGYTWTAKYWTQNDVPSANVNNVWTRGDACGVTSTVAPPSSTSTVAPPTSSTTTTSAATTSCTPGVEKTITGYFPNWLYSNYLPSQIEWSKYTHINYAFAVMYSGTTPSWADSGVLADDVQYGFPKLVAAAHSAGVKIAVSIGGWSGSVGFSSMVSTAAGRASFIAWQVSFIKQYNTDGVDIDWEYPGRQGAGCNGVNAALDTINLQLLVSELRASLDSNFPTVYKYITMAVRVYPFDGPNGPVSSVADFVPHVDRFNIMTFDINGAWSNVSGPNAPFQHDPTKGFQASYVAGIQAWIAAGVPKNKITGGIPLYGRAQTLKVTNPTTQYNDGLTPAPLGDSLDGPWQDAYCSSDTAAASGIWRWKNLRSQGVLTSPTTAASPWIRNFDTLTQTPWLFNPTTKMFISYDDPISVANKANYVVSEGLNGVFVWSVDEDNGELLSAMQVVRNPDGFPACPTPTSSTSPTETGSPSGCGEAWVATAAYSAGTVVSYGGYSWTAKYWTQNDTPGVSEWGPWTKSNACALKRRSGKRRLD